MALDLEADTKPLFLREGWRKVLCSCSDCYELLTKHNLTFLYEEEQTYTPEPDPDTGLTTYECITKNLPLTSGSRDKVAGKDGGSRQGNQGHPRCKSAG